MHHAHTNRLISKYFRAMSHTLNIEAPHCVRVVVFGWDEAGLVCMWASEAVLQKMCCKTLWIVVLCVLLHCGSAHECDGTIINDANMCG